MPTRGHLVHDMILGFLVWLREHRLHCACLTSLSEPVVCFRCSYFSSWDNLSLESFTECRGHTNEARHYIGYFFGDEVDDR